MIAIDGSQAQFQATLGVLDPPYEDIEQVPVDPVPGFCRTST